MSQLGQPGSLKYRWEEANSRWRVVLFDQGGNEQEYFGATLEDALKTAQVGFEALVGGAGGFAPGFTVSFGGEATAIFE